MITIYCPYCQENREEVEFGYAGEAFIERPPTPDQLDDIAWADYLFSKENHKGEQYEQWVHRSACRKFFIARRNTATHQFKQTWRFEDLPKKPSST